MNGLLTTEKGLSLRDKCFDVLISISLWQAALSVSVSLLGYADSTTTGFSARYPAFVLNVIPVVICHIHMWHIYVQNPGRQTAIHGLATGPPRGGTLAESGHVSNR